MAVVEIDRAIAALSERVDPADTRHGWTEATQFTAKELLENGRSGLLADGRVEPDHHIAWTFWYDDVGLATKTTDETDDRLELIRDVDLYDSRMYR